MAVNVPILVAILVFYLLIFIVGVWAARYTRKRKAKNQTESLIVGAKDIGVVVGIFTMAATWYGGVSINGTAQTVSDPGQGLAWAIAIPATSAAVILNGIFFVQPLREARYLSSLDPFGAKFGKYSTIIFFIIEGGAGVLFIGAVLTALGGTLEVVAGLPRAASVIVSAAISTVYTVLGGLYSVAYTDVVQLVIIVGGLILAIPFALTHEAVTSISETAYGPNGWLGAVPSFITGNYIDLWLSVSLGSIPLQVIYQRAFASKSTRTAQIVLIAGGTVALILMIPPVLIGAAGASTNWSMTGYSNGSGESPYERGESRLILPVILQYMTPTAVAFFGLGAVSAGVMSSMDSALLAVGTIFGRNIYQKLLRPRASELEIVIVIRVAIVVEAAAATVLALTINTILPLFYLCIDLTYVTTFPQLVSILWLDPNIYGSLPAVFIGLLLRLGAGDYLLNWAPTFHYVGGSNFPARTVAMVASFLTLCVFSYLAKILFEKGWIDEKYDFLHSNLARGGRTLYLDEDKKDIDSTNENNIELPGVKHNSYAEEVKDE